MNAWLASLLWPDQDEQDKVLRARLEAKDEAPNHQSRPLATLNGMQLYRIKGILSVVHSRDDHLDDEDLVFVDSQGLDSRRFIVQAVYDLWEIHPAGPDLSWGRPLGGEDEEDGSEGVEEGRSCKLIFIGRNLNETDLKSGFDACFVTGDNGK
eukprot:CAMPEP_0116577576 /NCGR_PEP_ID=MMETSP0397-20121206/21229_1 /TAXON_ID=216820 /ORGANISM="Cyclophora tenuis, Strain ECT3854" /LENGTH=152 /DNA_ID=CAMNT_0004106873 /DNA_START=188 /DNA_END=646 /DNA_ORIENTATION=-